VRKRALLMGIFLLAGCAGNAGRDLPPLETVEALDADYR
jgi:hypothetical protein